MGKAHASGKLRLAITVGTTETITQILIVVTNRRMKVGSRVQEVRSRWELWESLSKLSRKQAVVMSWTETIIQERVEGELMTTTRKEGDRELPRRLGVSSLP